MRLQQAATAALSAMVLAVQLGLPVRASTGDVEGVIVTGGPSSSSITFEARRQGYLSVWKSQWGPSNPDGVGPVPMPTNITVTGDDRPGGYSVCLVNGFLSNDTTLRNAIAPGRKLYMQNNRNYLQFIDLASTPIMGEGIIQSVDQPNNSFVYRNEISNGLGGTSDPMFIDVTVPINPAHVYRHEGADGTPASVLAAGRHVRVYAARPQTVLAMTPAAVTYNYPYWTNSAGNHQAVVQQGFFRGFSGSQIYFSEYRQNQWFNSFKPGSISKAHNIDTHYINAPGASARPGDWVVLVPYSLPAGSTQITTKQMFIRPNDDSSIEGVVVDVVGSTVTLQVTRCPTGRAEDVVTTLEQVTLAPDAEYHLDGIPGATQASAVQIGHVLRILAAWDGAVIARDVNTALMTLPAAPNLPPYFISDENQEFTLDGVFKRQLPVINTVENQTVLLEAFPQSITAMSFQWLRNGQPVPGATTSAYNRTVSMADHLAQFVLVATNSAGSRSSLPIVLNVLPDTSPLLISGASIADAQTILVRFSKNVQPGQSIYSAENPNNYQISGGINVNAATLIGDLQTVVLTTSALTKFTSYIITINNVQDLSATPNAISANTQVSVDYNVKFRYFRMVSLGQTGSLAPRVNELRYRVGAVEHGPGKTYFGRDDSSLAFDGNNSTYSQIGNTGGTIGLDMGSGFEIAPTQIRVTMTAASNRNLSGARFDGSNDQVNWTTIFTTNNPLNNGQTYIFDVDLSSLDPDDILTGAKQTQQIVFSPVCLPVTNPIALSPTASSSLPVQLFVLAGPGQLSGNALTRTGPGAIHLLAIQPGDADFYSAYPVQRYVADFDLNADSSVTAADLALLIAGLGSTDPLLDLTADGVVSANDVKALLQCFGQ